jgi:hypothetical protein
MTEVTYIIGAGINQAVKDWDNDSPPLLINFFNIALKKRKFKEEYYTNKIQDVYSYIEKCFRKTKAQLADLPFDLELCFTLLDQQIREARTRQDVSELRKLIMVHFHLKAFLAEVLSEFEHFASLSCVMRNLGKVILKEQPTLITFNYDCLIETVLESAFGVSMVIPQNYFKSHSLESVELPDDVLAYSHCKWNRPLGYGFKFDEIQLQQAGVSKYVQGTRFYSIQKNSLYSKPLLKLHGSLNWFHYLPIRTYPIFGGEKQPTLEEKELEIILTDGHWWFAEPPDHNGWLIDPIIITPVLYKDEYYNEKPFKEIWEHAKQALSKTKKLVVIGYSFSPTDFSSKRLLIEALITNELEELVVVNPDHNVLKTVKEICHYNGGIKWYSKLEDYLNTFSDSIHLEREIERVPKEELPKDTSPHDVFVKCKNCGTEFPIGIRTNPRSFATTRIFDYVTTCPIGHTCSYDIIDCFLKKVQVNNP